VVTISPTPSILRTNLIEEVPSDGRIPKKVGAEGSRSIKERGAETGTIPTTWSKTWAMTMVRNTSALGKSPKENVRGAEIAQSRARIHRSSRTKNAKVSVKISSKLKNQSLLVKKEARDK